MSIHEPSAPVRTPVSVVIPCRDRAELLTGCLAALRGQLRPGDEVLVVDNGTPGPQVERAAGAGGARVVRLDAPGASRARNAGWQAATHDAVVFTDDDMRPGPGWLDALAAGLGDAAFAVGRTELPAGVAAGGGTATVTVREPPARIVGAASGSVGASNNLAIRREVLRAVGGFDARLGPGTWFQAGEDVELFDRVLATGAEGRYVASAVSRHEQWRTDSDGLRLQYAYGKGMGARVACAIRRDPRTGVARLGDVVRMQGLVTVALRLARRGARRVPDPGTPAGTPPALTASGVPDVSGWRGPLLWRAGALVGLLAGLVALAPRPQEQP